MYLPVRQDFGQYRSKDGPRDSDQILEATGAEAGHRRHRRQEELQAQQPRSGHIQQGTY